MCGFQLNILCCAHRYILSILSVRILTHRVLLCPLTFMKHSGHLLCPPSGFLPGCRFPTAPPRRFFVVGECGGAGCGEVPEFHLRPLNLCCPSVYLYLSLLILSYNDPILIFWDVQTLEINVSGPCQKRKENEEQYRRGKRKE